MEVQKFIANFALYNRSFRPLKYRVRTPFCIVSVLNSVHVRCCKIANYTADWHIKLLYDVEWRVEFLNWRINVNLLCGFFAPFILIAVLSILPIFVILDWRMKVRGGMGGGCGSGGSSTGLCRPQRPILMSVFCCYRLQAVNKLNDGIY